MQKKDTTAKESEVPRADDATRKLLGKLRWRDEKK